MTEEAIQIEEMNYLATEKMKSGDDIQSGENLTKEDITMMNSLDSVGEPPHSPSHSLESDSNLKTETTESNSVEFSQDLHTEEVNDQIKEDTENDETIDGIHSESVIPDETTTNTEEGISNVPEETLDKAKESTISEDTSANDENNFDVPNEGSLQKDEEPVVKEARVEDKPVNGLKVCLTALHVKSV